MAAINHPLRHGRRAIPAPSFGKPNWWVAGAIILAVFSATLPVIQNSETTSRGFEVQSLQAEQASLRGDIGLLESDVARLTSLTRIQRRATQIGLIPAADPVYVNVDEPGPAPAKIPAEYLPAPAPRAQGSTPWWRSITEWLPLPD